MNLKLSAEDEAFRAIVRNYFAEEYPAEILAKLANGQTLTKADRQASENALYRRGWVAPGWPKQYGGPGWSITQRFIFEEELERAGAPSVVPMGLLYFAPVLYTFGTEEQKRRWLGDILASRTNWAQGYSEPEAGSDLASAHQRGPRRRRLSGQWREDLDQRRPPCRLDILPGKDLGRGPQTAGHHLPVPEYDQPGRHSRADHHHRRRPSPEPGRARQCPRA